MRLGQLARKLSIRPSEIVEFLAANNIPLEESSNTRLEEDHVILIMKQFGLTNELDETPPPVSSMDTDLANTPFPSAEGIEGIEAQPDLTESLPVFDKADEVKIEVIKAAKVELSGLKVVGKIELPELKKKDAPIVGIANDDSAQAQTKVQREVRKAPPYRKEVRKNPIALQREREAQEEERKRQVKAEQEKEQRTKNYYKKVKVSSPTKRIKMVEEPTTEMSSAELKESPRTWVGRFLNWLTT